MALRVPKAELTTELRESMIKQLGGVPEPVEVLWHSPKVALANLGQHGHQGQHGARDRVAGLLCCVRDSAGCTSRDTSGVASTA